MKSGQARVLTPQQQKKLFSEIRKHRHPEKNTAIMQISFKLGLRVQEIALLQLKEIIRLDNYAGFWGFSLQIGQIQPNPLIIHAPNQSF